MIIKNRNYYELLNCNIDDDCSIIKQKYQQKLLELANTTSVKDLEPYQDAYYHLSDEKRRIKYDRTIGIYHRRHIPGIIKIFGYIGRFILTLIDAAFELVFSLFIALALSGIGYYSYIRFYKKEVFIINDTIYKFALLTIIIFVACITAYLSQAKIRKWNRHLKNYLRKFE